MQSLETKSELRSFSSERMVLLSPPELSCLRDAIEALERQDGVRKLFGTAIQHRSGEGNELLLHCLPIGERVRLARRVGVQPLMHPVVGGDGDACAERVAAAGLKAVVLHDVEL